MTPRLSTAMRYQWEEKGRCYDPCSPQSRASIHLAAGGMRAMSSEYVQLTPILWHQHIHGFRPRQLGAECRMRDGYDLRTSNGDNLADHLVNLWFNAGAPRDEGGFPLESGVGRLFYDARDDGRPFYGWAFLTDDDQEALWQQITGGLFTDCVLDLVVGPEHGDLGSIQWDARKGGNVWMIDRGPLLIIDVELRFSRLGSLQPPNAGLSGRR